MKELDKLELQHGQNMSMTLDGWSDAAMQSLYGFLVLFPDGRSILQKVEDFSAHTHSGEFLASKHSSLQVVDVLTVELSLCRS